MTGGQSRPVASGCERTGPFAGRGLRIARRLAVGVIGTTVILLGIALLFLPGPAFVVIPVGLAILASEFVWARRMMRRLKASTVELVRRPAGDKGSDGYAVSENERLLDRDESQSSLSSPGTGVSDLPSDSLKG